MKKMVLVLIVVLCVSGYAFAEPELKGTPTELSGYLVGLPGTTVISGKAEIKAQADKVVVNIEVLTEKESFEKALKKNQEIREKVSKILMGKGIPAENVKTSRFSTIPEYGWLKKKVKKYHISHMVKITITNKGQFQEVAKVVDQTKEVKYKSLTYEHSKKEQFRQEALEKACQAVIRKKGVYENILQVRLTPLNIDSPQLKTRGALRDEGRYSSGMKLSQGVNISSSGMDALTEEATEFGQIIYTATINVKYMVYSKPDNK